MQIFAYLKVAKKWPIFFSYVGRKKVLHRPFKFCRIWSRCSRPKCRHVSGQTDLRFTDIFLGGGSKSDRNKRDPKLR